jgi:hypothetical protein
MYLGAGALRAGQRLGRATPRRTPNLPDIRMPNLSAGEAEASPAEVAPLLGERFS